MSSTLSVRRATLWALATALFPSFSVAEDVAVSLNSFTPRLGNLPSACNKVYQQQINGCSPDDFIGNNHLCSTSCIQGLVSVQKSVQQNCQDADVDASSIIGVFLSGTGIQYLCPNVVLTTLQSSSTSTQASSSTAKSSAQQTSTTEKSSQAATTAATATSTATSTAASTGGISVDTSVASTFITQPPAQATANPQSSTSATSAQTTNTQKSNSDSGGGSPFDIVAADAAPPRGVAKYALLGVAAVVYVLI